MMPRNFDERVGFDTESFVDFGTDEHRSVRKRIINRFRLEKKDPNAAVVRPVKPIVFYIDPATPAKWVPFVKTGVESWQPAFEAAGFRNAIEANDAPKNDPEWSAEDARYSVIHWVPTQTEAQSLINDPRSGEILSASLDVYPNVAHVRSDVVLRAGRRRRQARAATAAARRSAAASCMRFQVAHQIGHALGLPHNLKASSIYTIAQVRDPKWVKENGFVAVDHGRRALQLRGAAGRRHRSGRSDSEDRSVRQVRGHVGLQADSDARRRRIRRDATLDQWAREQDAKPYLRFSTEGAAASDPGDERRKPSATWMP